MAASELNISAYAYKFKYSYDLAGKLKLETCSSGKAIQTSYDRATGEFGSGECRKWVWVGEDPLGNTDPSGTMDIPASWYLSFVTANNF